METENFTNAKRILNNEINKLLIKFVEDHNLAIKDVVIQIDIIRNMMDVKEFYVNVNFTI